ncbi:hypothetical protein M5K25_018212 [Dendrobium thyrsiflorum]|uniref:Uncharacterized protein n=1 Tax=Dendrobium thyrsiflorum TaxID=117978 RepID=A0ABD0UHD7_DENTH
MDNLTLIFIAEEEITPEDGNVEANEEVFSMIRGFVHHERVRPQGFDVIQTRYFPQSTTEGGSGSGSISNLDQIASLREEVFLLRAEIRDFQSLCSEMREFIQQMHHTFSGSLQMGE